jgi:hypothetical protein
MMSFLPFTMSTGCVSLYRSLEKGLTGGLARFRLIEEEEKPH